MFKLKNIFKPKNTADLSEWIQLADFLGIDKNLDKGTKIEAYVDGLSASASSFLMMVADNVNLYKNSTVKEKQNQLDLQYKKKLEI